MNIRIYMNSVEKSDLWILAWSEVLAIDINT